MMNNKGFILIGFYMIVTVLVILVSGFAVRSIGEHRATLKSVDTIQALWLAEAGVDRAIAELPASSLSGSLGKGVYSVQTTDLGGGKFLIVSYGGIPGIDVSDPDNAIRKISAIVERPTLQADPSGVTSAITANGEVIVKGGAEVNGDIDENAAFNFGDIFAISKEVIKDNATHTYIDPPNNVMPVDQITWVEIDTLTEMRITESGWSGSGLLVVDGNLTITGGYFYGIIWVIGTLRISGNPVIDGAIYVESGAEVETTLTGNPTVNFNSNAVEQTFGYLPSNLPPRIIGWKED